MNKVIICMYGRSNEGKTKTIIKFFELLKKKYNIENLEIKNIDSDIFGSLEIDNIRIGINSQGDPNSESIINKKTKELAEKSCEIIVCSSRTKGNTVWDIDKVADGFDFHTIWISSYYSPQLDYEVLNSIAADSLLQVFDSVLTGKI